MVGFRCRLLPRRRGGGPRRCRARSKYRAALGNRALRRAEERARSISLAATRPGRCRAKPSLGLTFAGATYYDGQGFMVPRSRTVARRSSSAAPRSACRPGRRRRRTSPTTLPPNNMTYDAVSRRRPRTKRSPPMVRQKCDVDDQRRLAALCARARNCPTPASTLSSPRSSPRSRSARWSAQTTRNGRRWSNGCLRAARRRGARCRDRHPRSRRLPRRSLRSAGWSASTGGFGEELGLANQWAANAIRLVGNYGEIFERNLGSQLRRSASRAA